MHRASDRGWLLLRGGSRTSDVALLTSRQMSLPDQGAVETTDYKPLETIVNGIVKEKQVFQRLSLSKENLYAAARAPLNQTDAMIGWRCSNRIRTNSTSSRTKSKTGRSLPCTATGC